MPAVPGQSIVAGMRALTVIAAGLCRGAAFAVLAAVALPSGASAIEHCVVCAGPDAVYRCRIDTVATGRREAAAQLVCITTLAQDGGHQSCSVRRAASEVCPGPLRLVALPDGGAGGDVAEPASQGAGSGAAPATTMAPRPVEEQKGSAQTVEALAKDAAQGSGAAVKSAGEAVSDTTKAAGQQIEKLGGAISGAAKKTWGCIASLFSDCK